MANMALKYVMTNEVKCNFCFNWINGFNYVKKQINICESCLERYLQNQCQVHTMSGQSYKLYIQKQRNKNICTKSFIDNLEQIVHEVSQKGQQAQSNKIIQQFSEINQYQSQGIDQDKDNYYPLKNENKHFQRNRNHAKSQISQENSHYQSKGNDAKPHQSCIFNIGKQFQIKEPMSAIKNMKKYNKLQDFGKSLDKTRFISKYKFHYDQKTIKSFTQSNRKIQRQFGDELNVQQFSLNNASEMYIQQSFMQKSMMSNESSKKYLKASDDEIKTKIDILLQQQSQQYSETHKRLIASQMKEIYQCTQIENTTLELISYNISSVDLEVYLNLFQYENIHTIKLINVGLTDSHLFTLLNFIKNKNIQSLALTGNKLTENCLTMFLSGHLPYLKEIYLGKNPINKSGLKENIIQLKSKFILYI